MVSLVLLMVICCLHAGSAQRCNRLVATSDAQVARFERKLKAVEKKLNFATDKLKKVWRDWDGIKASFDVCKPPKEEEPTDCLDARTKGRNSSGVYSFTTPFPYRAYCDMRTDNGGWLVVQKRFDGSTDFYRNWTEYANGFGNVRNEYWLGLELLHNITSGGNYELRIDFKDYNGSKKFAKYSHFSVGPASRFFTLYVGEYSGNAGDGLSYHRGKKFSTFDRDNDGSIDHADDSSCAEMLHGAWWYDYCAHSNLNGRYFANRTSNFESNFWSEPAFTYFSRKATEMKIRRKQ